MKATRRALPHCSRRIQRRHCCSSQLWPWCSCKERGFKNKGTVGSYIYERADITRWYALKTDLKTCAMSSIEFAATKVADCREP